jgi:hypothetical protein
MKKYIIPLLMIAPVLSSCSFEKQMKAIEHKAALINKYENVALKLAKENRELRVEIKRLEFEVEKLKQENAYKKISKPGSDEDSSAGHGGDSLAKATDVKSRSIASVSAQPVFNVKKDLVEYKTYKWSAEDMIKIADKEFKAKNFEKAAQFYTSLLNYYPKHKAINDEYYFKAGISAFESGEHHDWTLSHFETLMNQYPTSSYFRSAKLWVALTHLKLGKKDKFFSTVEEFRKKYRNTNEWKILSSYYEKIEEKTHE